MLGISADVSGAHRMLDRIGDRLDDGTALLKQLGEGLVEYERDVFASHGDGTWGQADLVETGDLLAKLTGTPDFDLGSDTIEAKGTEYAGYLKAGARGMPKRDPAPTPPSHVVERWARDLLDTLLGPL